MEELCRSVKRLQTEVGAENRGPPIWAGGPYGSVGGALVPQQLFAAAADLQHCSTGPLRPINQQPLPLDEQQAAGSSKQHPYVQPQQVQQAQEGQAGAEIDWLSYDQANRLLGQLHVERLGRQAQPPPP